MNKPIKKKLKKINKIQLAWGLICSMSSTDQQTNNISLFNIIETIGISKNYFNKQKQSKKPLLFHCPHELILFWKRTMDVGLSPEEIHADLRIKTINPDNEIQQEMIIPLNFPSDKQNLRFKINIQGLVAKIPGSYVYRIEIKFFEEEKFKEIFEIPFQIKEVAKKTLIE